MWTLLIFALGCSDVCGNVALSGIEDQNRANRCRIIDGELLVQSMSIGEFSLPRLEEVTGERVLIDGPGQLYLPNLHTIGTGRETVQVELSALSTIDLPALEAIGEDALPGEIDPWNRSLMVSGGLDGRPTVSIPQLTDLTTLTLDGVIVGNGLAGLDELEAFTLRDTPDIDISSLPPVYAAVIIDHETLTTLDLPFRDGSNAPETIPSLVVENSPALVEVNMGIAGFARFEDNAALERLTVVGSDPRTLYIEGPHLALSELSLPDATGLHLWARPSDMPQLVIDAPAMDCVDYEFGPMEGPPPCP